MIAPRRPSPRVPSHGSGPRRIGGLVLALVLGATASGCGAGSELPAPSETVPTVAASLDPITVPPPVSLPVGELPAGVPAALDALAHDPWAPGSAVVDQVVSGGDLRAAWVLADLLAVNRGREVEAVLIGGLTALVGAAPSAGQDPWTVYADVLVRWEVEPPPGYPEWKHAILLSHHPDWEGVLSPVDPVDWRMLAPAAGGADPMVPLVGPAVVGASGGRWLPGSDRVVGVEIDGEARAYPLRVLAAHAVVEDRLAEHGLAVVQVPSTGSLAVFDLGGGGAVTGGVEPGESGLAMTGLALHGAELLVSRPSGSLVDPVSGAAHTGSMRATGSGLDPLPFVLTTWDEWRQAHPGSTVVAPDGGIGRVYLSERAAARPLPARPLGASDDRLEPGTPVLALVVGAGRSDPRPLAFALGPAEVGVVRGDDVAVGPVHLQLDAGGLVAHDRSGQVLPGAVVPWSEWVRAHPDTEVWTG